MNYKPLARVEAEKLRVTCFRYGKGCNAVTKVIRNTVPLRVPLMGVMAI